MSFSSRMVDMIPRRIYRICCSCHALIIRGCSEDRVPRAMAAFLHQLHQSSISFLPVTPPGKGKFKNVNPLDRLPTFTISSIVISNWNSNSVKRMQINFYKRPHV